MLETGWLTIVQCSADRSVSATESCKGKERFGFKRGPRKGDELEGEMEGEGKYTWRIDKQVFDNERRPMMFEGRWKRGRLVGFGLSFLLSSSNRNKTKQNKNVLKTKQQKERIREMFEGRMGKFDLG